MRRVARGGCWLMMLLLTHCGSEASDEGHSGSAREDARTPHKPDVDRDLSVGERPADCKDDERSCTGARPQRCEGGRWIAEPSCGDSARCEAGACVELALPSCREPGPGRSDCGDDGDCCASPWLPGGSFFVGFRTVIGDQGITDEYDRSDGAPRGTVSALRLDAFPVTVGRIRPFLQALRGGWRPEAGDGVHRHLHQGRGLAHSGGFEAGWNPTWNDDLQRWLDDWEQGGFHGCQSDMTFSAEVGAREKVAANCLNGRAAYAFCIWDDGFLPSWTEWQLAAAAGAEQRSYPWGEATPGPQHIDLHGRLARSSALGFVDAKPAGRGAFGHWGLIGGVTDRALDGDAPRPAPCLDCYAPGEARAPSMVLGGHFNSEQATKSFDYDFVGGPSQYHGVRCARRP